MAKKSPTFQNMTAKPNYTHRTAKDIIPGATWKDINRNGHAVIVTADGQRVTYQYFLMNELKFVTSMETSKFLFNFKM
jgi:hypothetical protein